MRSAARTPSKPPPKSIVTADPGAIVTGGAGIVTTPATVILNGTTIPDSPPIPESAPVIDALAQSGPDLEVIRDEMGEAIATDLEAATINHGTSADLKRKVEEKWGETFAQWARRLGCSVGELRAGISAAFREARPGAKRLGLTQLICLAEANVRERVDMQAVLARDRKLKECSETLRGLARCAGAEADQLKAELAVANGDAEEPDPTIGGQFHAAMADRYDWYQGNITMPGTPAEDSSSLDATANGYLRAQLDSRTADFVPLEPLTATEKANFAQAPGWEFDASYQGFRRVPTQAASRSGVASCLSADWLTYRTTLTSGPMGHQPSHCYGQRTRPSKKGLTK